MSKWKAPTLEQADMAVDLGLDPEGVVVRNVGMDCFIIFHLKSAAEYYVGSDWIIGSDSLGRVIFKKRKPQALSETGGNYGRQEQTEVPPLRDGAGTERDL